jgi:hypothetical protein
MPANWRCHLAAPMPFSCWGRCIISFGSWTAFRRFERPIAFLSPEVSFSAAAVSRFASLIDGLASGFFRDPEFRRIVAVDLASGQHRNTTSNSFYFTTAYFHRPEDLAGEVRSVHFEDLEIIAFEGPAWSASHFSDSWNDAAQRQNLLELLSLIEREPSVVGASAHFMALAHRPA